MLIAVVGRSAWLQTLASKLSEVVERKITLLSSTEKVTKVCNSDGQWFHHPESKRVWSNYTLCPAHTKEKRKVAHGSVTRLVFCLLSEGELWRITILSLPAGGACSLLHGHGGSQPVHRVPPRLSHHLFLLQVSAGVSTVSTLVADYELYKYQTAVRM